VLASSSVYRRALLDRFGLEFEVVSPEVDEQARPGELPGDTARRLALAKSEAVAQQFPDAVIIGSDQVACCEGLRLDKPLLASRAEEALLAVRGKSIDFHTALCVFDSGSGKRLQHTDLTRVQMRADLDPASIRRYVELDRPLDCAGSARIESLGVALLERCQSDDPTALVGLPLIALARLLRDVGIDPLQPAPRPPA